MSIYLKHYVIEREREIGAQLQRYFCAILPLPPVAIRSRCIILCFPRTYLSSSFFFFLLPGTDGRVRVCTSNWLVVWNAAREASLRRSDPSSLLFFLFCFTSSFFFFPPVCVIAALYLVLFFFSLLLSSCFLLSFFFFSSLFTHFSLSFSHSESSTFSNHRAPFFHVGDSCVSFESTAQQLHALALCFRLVYNDTYICLHVGVCVGARVRVRLHVVFLFLPTTTTTTKKSAVCVCTYAPAMFGS